MQQKRVFIPHAGSEKQSLYYKLVQYSDELDKCMVQLIFLQKAIF